MATIHDERESGVEYTHEEGLVTATDIETGVASCGVTKAEALAMLSEALALHEGEPIEDEAEFFREIGVDPDGLEDDPTPPPWLE